MKKNFKQKKNNIFIKVLKIDGIIIKINNSNSNKNQTMIQ